MQVRQNSLGWPNRSRRTHKDPWQVTNMKKRGLVATLKANFKIREKNEQRREKDGEFMANPRGNRPGSPQESEFTVESKDWDLLKASKTLWDQVKQWLSPEKMVEIEKAHTSSSNSTSTPRPDEQDDPSSGVAPATSAHNFSLILSDLWNFRRDII
ncbi:hypothetical protein PQX77_017525 [Marasmius sp. AFHP31]|nr:hypothetical protein PQX77_017525 [Marasmius sp. AFHP31]